MTETNFSRAARPILSPRHTDATGVDRCYVRFAVIGDRLSPPRSGSGAWPQLLARTVGQQHDVSFCDLAQPGATAYDVRRVQLREALVHRPHLVALTAGRVDAGRRDWDPESVRSHLLHCAVTLTRHGALLLTAPPRTGLLLRCARRGRLEQLAEIYDEIHTRFDTLRLDDPDPSGQRREHPDTLVRRAVEQLAERGLQIA